MNQIIWKLLHLDNISTNVHGQLDHVSRRLHGRVINSGTGRAPSSVSNSFIRLIPMQVERALLLNTPTVKWTFISGLRIGVREL